MYAMADPSSKLIALNPVIITDHVIQRLAKLHRLNFRVSASQTLVHALFAPRFHWLNKPKPHWRFAPGARAKDELRWLGDFRWFRHIATLEVRAADGDLSISTRRPSRCSYAAKAQLSWSLVMYRSTNAA